jgi:sulfatase maturation enzyme AslB (radical SAM superfamily)
MARFLPVVPSIVGEEHAIRVPFGGLDTLWLQLTGTLCNIACRHCFITCGPLETRVPMMTRGRIEALLREARELGIRDYYLTGGEPMLHPEFFAIVERILEEGPVSVLTNGILIDDPAAARLRALFDRARYSLDLRVSLDGMTAEENDPVRGRGTFAQITRGVAALARAGLSPVLTVVEHQAGMAAEQARVRFLAFARGLGLPRPRLKFLPLLHIGREERRTRGYGEDEVVHGPLDPEVLLGLQCGSSRLATEEHVLTCPLLLDAPEARMGRTLKEALRPVPLRWSACHTCVVEGLSCRT